MLSVARIADESAIRSIVHHPDIWGRVAEHDGLQWRYEPNDVYLGVFREEMLVGVWHVQSKNGVCGIVHPMILPEHRTISSDSEKLLCSWLKVNSKARKLIAEIPSIYRDVVWFASRCGYNREGRLRNACQRRGDVMDLIIMGKELWVPL